MRRMTTIVAWVGLVAGSTACKPHYDGIKIRVLTGHGEATSEGVELEEGTIMAVEIKPISSNPYEDYEDFNLVELESLNETILSAAPADDVNRFALIGAGVGTTSIDVIVDGRTEDAMSARVLPQVTP